jgi:hypothetical protein
MTIKLMDNIKLHSNLKCYIIITIHIYYLKNLNSDMEWRREERTGAGAGF